jgi:hypothetical protein
MKFLLGIIVGFCICAIGIDVIMKTVRIGSAIVEYTIQDQWMKNKHIEHRPQPPMIDQPREIDDAKTI